MLCGFYRCGNWRVRSEFKTGASWSIDATLGLKPKACAKRTKHCVRQAKASGLRLERASVLQHASAPRFCIGICRAKAGPFVRARRRRGFLKEAAEPHCVLAILGYTPAHRCEPGHATPPRIAATRDPPAPTATMPPRKKPAARKTAAKKRKAPEPEVESRRSRTKTATRSSTRARPTSRRASPPPRPRRSTRSSTAGSSAVWRRRARI